LYVLDPYGEPVGVGLPGELYIGGVQLARGYWQQEALTREKFIDNPFGQGRLYRTGDLARWQQDGNVEYLGRIDGQVKIRGYRIEPAEIEHAIRRFDQVIDAVVIARARGENGEDRELVGYVTGRDGLIVADVKRYLEDILPDYMIPRALVRMDAFPLTPNGKIDKARLPDPAANAGESEGNGHVSPRNGVEKKLARIWQDTLGTDQEIGVTDDFFQLGGHSIMAIKVVSQVLKEFEVKLSIETLFDGATIENLAKYIGDTGWPGAEASPEENDQEYEKLEI
ncbi:MAG TPA: non-ribosomal peptide synthetase, partial [Cytophagales bacterium]